MDREKGHELSLPQNIFPKGNEPADPKKYALTTFKKSGLKLHADGEINGLIATAGTNFAEDDFHTVLQEQSRFDGPVTVMKDRWDAGKKVEHYELRQTLKELPEYMQYAKEAGLSYEQAVELLTLAFRSTRFEHMQTSHSVKLLKRLYQRAAKENVQLGQHADVIAEMIRVCGEADLIDSALYSSANAMRLGLSVPQACELASRIPREHGSIAGYWMGHFNDALKSMLPGKVNPALVMEMFDVLCSENGWSHSQLLDSLKHLITFAGPARNMTSDELLSLFLTRLKSKGQLALPSDEAAGGGQEAPHSLISKDKYFIENQNDTLEFAALPYRKKASLNDGVRALEKMAVAHSALWEETGEGMWAFDPASETWYSFGGQLELPSMEEVLQRKCERVRHNFLPYDISELSNAPVLFHVHPEDYETFLVPDEEALTIPQIKYGLVKFLTATPSGADYGTVADLMEGAGKPVPTRACIAHALGVTEYTYPNDVAALRDMRTKFRAIRDEVMMEFDLDGYIERHGWPVDRLHMTQSLITLLNEKLPKEFRIILHPTGHDFSRPAEVDTLQAQTRRNVRKRLK